MAAEKLAASVSPSPCDAISHTALQRLFDGQIPRSSGDSALLAYRFCTWSGSEGRKFEARLTAEPSIADPMFKRSDAAPVALGTGFQAVFVPEPLFLEGSTGASVVLRAHGVAAFLQLVSDRLPSDTQADLTRVARALAPRLRAGA